MDRCLFVRGKIKFGGIVGPHPPHRCRVSSGLKLGEAGERARTRAILPPPRRCVASSSSSCCRGAKNMAAHSQKIRCVLGVAFVALQPKKTNSPPPCCCVASSLLLCCWGAKNMAAHGQKIRRVSGAASVTMQPKNRPRLPLVIVSPPHCSPVVGEQKKWRSTVNKYDMCWERRLWRCSQ